MLGEQISSLYDPFHHHGGGGGPGEEEDEESLIGHRSEDGVDEPQYRPLEDNQELSAAAIAPVESEAKSAFFLRMPQEDRTKYEKLKSKKGQFASDESETELMRGGRITTATALGGGSSGNADISNETPWTSSKRLKFKQMNIPTQIPAILSKKFNKATKSGGKRRGLADPHAPTATASAGAGEQEGEGDADSIGSASDLRADEEGEQAKVGALERKDRREDGISESIRTCGSSSYHAECESLTTNEDSVSRLKVSRKMRLKRRTELNALAEANRHPEDDDEEEEDEEEEVGVHHVDKPLLLDDELDYGLDSEDQRNFQTTSDDTQQEEEGDTTVAVDEDGDDDVFGLAPFKMPEIPKRFQGPKKIQSEVVVRSREESLETPRAELEFAFPEPTHPVMTSTPLKTVLVIPEATTVAHSLNPFLENSNISSGSSISLSSSVTPVAASQPSVLSTSSYGTVTVNCVATVDLERPTRTQSDLFGSEPFPSVVVVPSWPKVAMPPTPPVNRLPPVNVVTIAAPPKRVERPAAIVVAPVHSYTPSAAAAASILPIADTEFVHFAANDPILGDGGNELEPEDNLDLMEDDDLEEIMAEGDVEGGKQGDNGTKKKGKSKKFKLNGGSLVATKLKIPNYKKQSSSSGGGGEGQEDVSFSYQTVKAGFNNMSFEDFPSDEQEQFEQQQVGKKFSKAGTTKLNKIVPFEVVRSDKGEKKFGSLKRRSNPFS